MEEIKQKKGRQGNQSNQKYKHYFLLQYLMKHTDKNNIISTKKLIEEILPDYGILAERKALYRDIEAINTVILMVEENCGVEEAKELLTENEGLKTIVYDKHRRGFYVQQRHFDWEDMRLLAECAYASKFITQSQANRLVDAVCEFVSEQQAEQIRHDAFLTDRIKTNNAHVMRNISRINEAMNPTMNAKITFKYLTRSINDLSQQVERKKGTRYTVSPFRLLINDGNYYLLAFSDQAQGMRTFRVDRMRDVKPSTESRVGAEEYAKIDMRTYTQHVFSMFGGELQRVTIRFINKLLDPVVEKLGTNEAHYRQVDNYHFEVSAPVEVSDQFYGWILGFGKKAQIVGPPSMVEKFKTYLDGIRERY